MLRYMQGFEMIAPMTGTTHLGAAEVQRLLGLQLPANAASFFNSSGPVVTDAERRIGGNSLMIVRDAADYHSTDYLDLTYAFDAVQTAAVVGFAFKFSTAIDASGVVPIAQFSYNAEGEQLSVWVTDTGSFFVGTDDFDVTTKSEQSTTALLSAETPVGTNLLEWNYIEISVDYSGTTPAVKIEVNGRLQLDWQVNAAFQKQATAAIDRVSIINALNVHFAGDDSTQYLDDVYIAAGNASLGPQHVVRLVPNATVTTQTVITGDITSHHALVAKPFNKHVVTNYLSDDPEGDGGITADYYMVSDIDTPIGSISGIQIGVIAAYSDVEINARYGYRYLDEEVVFTSAVDVTDPTYFYTTVTGLENDDGFTRSAVNALQLIVGSEV